MKNKMLWFTVSLLVALVLLGSGFGCGTPTATPTPTPTATPTPTPTATPTPTPTTTYQMTWASGFLADTGQNTVNQWWIDQLQKRTNGRVQIKFIPGGTAMKLTEALTVLQQGAVDAGELVVSYFPSQLPILGTISNLGVFSSHIQSTGILMRMMFEEGEISPVLQGELQKFNMKPLWIFGDLSNKLLSRDPITRLADLNGKKSRTTGNYLPILYKKFGAVPVTVMAAEWYEALSRGTVDTIAVPRSYVVPYKLHEVAKYESFNMGAQTSQVIVMNINSWNKLPTDIQQVILQLNKEAVQQLISTLTSMDNQFIDQMKAAKVTFFDVSKDEQKMIDTEWRRILQEVWVNEMTNAGKGKEATAISNLLVKLLSGT